MRVGWLMDVPDLPGGAEFTQDEFRACAPEGVEIVDCPPGGVVPGLERYVIHNCVQYPLADLHATKGGRVAKYHHDVGPWLLPEVTAWLRRHALNIFCSPQQAEYMGLVGRCIPPPVDLERFAEAGAKSNGGRAGAVSVGSWRNYGKAPHKAAQWGALHGGIDFYGGGLMAPQGSIEVPQDRMPELLASYETFVFLPTVIEPFGRLVAEAWAAGCEIVTNELVGAGYWIKHNPDAIETAGEDFWRVILGDDRKAVA